MDEMVLRIELVGVVGVCRPVFATWMFTDGSGAIRGRTIGIFDILATSVLYVWKPELVNGYIGA